MSLLYLCNNSKIRTCFSARDPTQAHFQTKVMHCCFVHPPFGGALAVIMVTFIQPSQWRDYCKCDRHEDLQTRWFPTF